MMELISNVAGIIVMSCLEIFSWHHLENKKINYMNYKIYIVLMLYLILLLVSVFFIDKFLKIVCIVGISVLLNYYLMECNIKKSLLMVIIMQIVIMASEVLLALIFQFFKVDLNAIVNQTYGGFMMDTSVSIVVILVTLTGILSKVYQMIIRRIDKINSEYFIALSFISVLVANVLAATVYYKIDFKNLLLFNSFVTVVYFTIIMHSFVNKNNYLKVNDKYNTTLSSLKEYEDILNRYRVSNHENKNQLLTIRNMIKNSENNIPEYIDTLVENKLKDNELLMGQTSIIPEGGLRGVVYAKSLVMKSKNIDFDLSIDKAIRTVDLHKIGEQTILDICRILGVFLDNAIEAVENLDERFVDLEMGIEKKYLSISVTNNFVGSLDVERMEETGYSTKGKGHGYGLVLVKEILEKNHLLKNEKRISNNEFTQRLIINISKIK